MAFFVLCVDVYFEVCLIGRVLKIGISGQGVRWSMRMFHMQFSTRCERKQLLSNSLCLKLDDVALQDLVVCLLVWCSQYSICDSLKFVFMLSCSDDAT